MYVYGSLRKNLYPTLTEIKTAQQLADDEDPRSRDQRPLHSILARISTASPRLSGLILTRKTALTSFDFVIRSNNPDRAEKIKSRLQRIYQDICAAVIDARLFGVAAVGLSWEVSKELSSVAPVISKRYHITELERTADGDISLLEYQNNNNRFKRLPAENSGKLIVISDISTMPGGILRSLLYHEYLRNETIKEWSNFNRKLKGLIQAKADDGQKPDAAAALKNFILNNYAVTDKDVEFVLNDLTSSKSLESFPAFLDYLNKEINIAILGQANMTELPNNSGSRAALQILNLIRSDILFSDMQLAKQVFNQIVKYDYQMNVSKNSDPDASFEFVFDDNSDLETTARIIELAVDSGIPLIKSEVYERIGFTPPADDDEIFELNKPSMRI